MHKARSIPLLAGLALALLLPAGCRSRIPIERTQSGPMRASPVVRGSGAGLETWYWVVSDQRIPRQATTDNTAPTPLPAPGSGASATPDNSLDQTGPPAPAFTVIDDKRDIEEVLAPYADRALPLGSELVRRWTASGLRLYSVPRADLERIEARLRLIAPVQRQWLGEVPAWTSLAEGPWSQGPLAVYVAGDTVRLDPGRIQLLARAWTAPLPGSDGPEPSLRIEIVPQHQPALSSQEELFLSAGLPAAPEDRGLRFDRLGGGLSLTTDDCLVIVPTPRPGPDEAPRPFRITPRSLGDAMLTRDATEETPRARAVIVIIPHIAERFDLLH